MDFRSSNSVAALALLIASGGCALFTPAARAGDRLEFSTPAIPLAVPHPDVETKAPKKMTGSDYMAAGIMESMDIGPQQQTIIRRSKQKDEDAWDSNPLLGEDQDKRDSDDWLTARPEPNHLTNSSSLNMPHGWEARASDDLSRRRNDSGLEAGQNASRFGSQIGLDGDNARDGDRYGRFGDLYSRDSDRDAKDIERNGRDGDRFGREYANDKEASIWSKKFSGDSSGADRFNAVRFMPFKDESGNFGVGANELRVTEPGSAADSAYNAALPGALLSGFGNSTPLDDSQSRLIGEQTGEEPGANQELRAWEPPPSSFQPSRSSSNPGQTSASRMMAPNRPINLPFPKRPDSPF